jgi:long-chain acyl-CoA synthetase
MGLCRTKLYKMRVPPCTCEFWNSLRWLFYSSGCCRYGNSFESCLLAVVVPSPMLMDWAAGQGITGSMEEVCANPKAVQYMLQELTATAKAGKLKGFETVRALHLDAELFSVENDLLTPSFKLKRPQLQKKYQKEIDAMYAKMKA